LKKDQKPMSRSPRNKLVSKLNKVIIERQQLSLNKIQLDKERSEVGLPQELIELHKKYLDKVPKWHFLTERNTNK
jgi:hypothetical protein